MSAVIAVLNAIKAEIRELPFDDFGSIPTGLIADHVTGWNRLPATEEMLHLPPDTGEDVPTERLLGSYAPMRSPGRISLYTENLKTFFWSVVREIGSQSPGLGFTCPDLERLAQLVVDKTYQHERFHYACDVLRHLFQGAFDSKVEEALAVAYARQQINAVRANGNTYLGRMNSLIYHRAMKIAFAYSSPGYRDWRLYADPASFRAGLLDYIAPPSSILLQGSGVPLAEMLQDLLRYDGGFEEQAL